MKITLALTLAVLAYASDTSFLSTEFRLGIQSAFAETEGDDSEDEECPDGFEESEEKCTPEEREDGCRDIRLDNGKGCVDRD